MVMLLVMILCKRKIFIIMISVILDVLVAQHDMDHELPLGVCMGITGMTRVGGRI